VIAVASVDELDFGRGQVGSGAYDIEFFELDAGLS
jgi:hypothetical protein